jgi:hypothetical protein
MGLYGSTIPLAFPPLIRGDRVVVSLSAGVWSDTNEQSVISSISHENRKAVLRSLLKSVLSVLIGLGRVAPGCSAVTAGLDVSTYLYYVMPRIESILIKDKNMSCITRL